MRTRGWVRTVDSEPVPGAPDQQIVELHITDADSHEQYCRWKSAHFAQGKPVTELDLRHGDDVDVVLVADGHGGYTAASYVHNHTRGVRYTLAPLRTGCLTVLTGALALVGAVLQGVV